MHWGCLGEGQPICGDWEAADKYIQKIQISVVKPCVLPFCQETFVGKKTSLSLMHNLWKHDKGFLCLLNQAKTWGDDHSNSKTKIQNPNREMFGALKMDLMHF